MGLGLQHTALLRKLRNIRRYVNQRVFEREAETDAILQTFLSGQSCFILGAKGTAKTDIIRMVSKLFGLSMFDILLSPSTKPSDVFGPADVPALAKGVQRNKISEYAAGKQIIFFDEIWKANGMVLNPLLRLLNEHEYLNGDDGVIYTPTYAILSASNEIPTDSELGAAYDRFIIRLKVDYLKERRNQHKMIQRNIDGFMIDPPEALTIEEVDRLRSLVDKIVIPAEVREVVIKIKEAVEQALMFDISDRRLVKSFKIIQAAALLAGRDIAEVRDAEVVANIFWDKPDQISRVRSTALGYASADTEDVYTYEEVAESIWQNAIKTGEMNEAITKLREIRQTTRQFSTTAGKRVSRRISGYICKAKEVLDNRTNFAMLEMMADGERFFKLTTTSASNWSAKLLRSVDFHWYKEGQYWYHAGPGVKASKKRRIGFKNKMLGKIKAQLGVEPTITRIGGL